MSLGLARDEDRLSLALARLREDLKRLTPRMGELEEALGALPGSRGLTGPERFSVLRGLERVWHIMRLLALLSEYFGERLVFGGGSILNYIFMVGAGEPPRLTFDLDSSWHRRVGGKRVLLGEMAGFNRWLADRGELLYFPVSSDGRVVPLYIVEYDVEKDYFPDLLSLRVPVVTRYDGQPFYEFLGITDYTVIRRLRSLFREVLGVSNPRVDYVRFEVSLEPVGASEPAGLETIFGQRIRARITPVEDQLAYKIGFKLAKDFGADLRHALHDLLKAVLDLRLLDYVDSGSVIRRANLAGGDVDVVRRNLEAVATQARSYYERNYHYTLVRKAYTLDQVIARVRRRLGV